MQKISTQTDTSASDTDAANAVEGERIAKYLARAGVASRREVERMIAQGIITVDGTVLSTPAFKVTPAMDIRVDGTRVGKPDRARVWRYHKPDNLVTTHADPQGRRTVFQALEGQVPRVISVGRLDLTTEGLLLLTNDGGLARTLELPSTGWTRRYRVRAWGRVKQDRLDALKDGITIEGIRYGPIRAQVDSQQGDNVWVTLSIKEGKNREVRTIMRALDLQVNRLIRTAYGPFQLGKLARGAVEEVTPKQLKDQLGKKLCTQIGLE